MLVPHLLAAYVFVGLSLFGLGFVLSCQGPLSTHGKRASRAMKTEELHQVEN